MKTINLFSTVIWLLALVATAAGIFYTTSEPHLEHITIRGENAVFQGSGLYRYDPTSVAREGIVWDVINLAIGLPLFAFAIVLNHRNSLRGRILLTGLLFYFFYVYMMYAVMIAFNPLFPLYIVIFALSLVTFIMLLLRFDLTTLRAHISDRFPRQLFIGYSFGVGVALILLWSRLIVSVISAGRFPAELAGITTLETQAFDLGLLVPLAFATGITLRRRSPLGYLLAGILITHGIMMFITIPTWIAVPLIQDGRINLIEATPFLLLCLIGIYLAVTYYRNVRETPQPTR